MENLDLDYWPSTFLQQLLLEIFLTLHEIFLHLSTTTVVNLNE